MSISSGFNNILIRLLLTIALLSHTRLVAWHARTTPSVFWRGRPHKCVECCFARTERTIPTTGLLNGTIFKVIPVPALRNQDTLSKYLQLRHPNWDLSPLQVQQLLCSTGGIGRHVHLQTVQNKPLHRGEVQDLNAIDLGYIATLFMNRFSSMLQTVRYPVLYAKVCYSGS